jgi:hypothetical protein
MIEMLGFKLTNVKYSKRRICLSYVPASLCYIVVIILQIVNIFLGKIY